MKIALAAPVRPGETSGNDVTAARWARRFRELYHTVEHVVVEPDRKTAVPSDADLLVALHARRCADPIRRWAVERPGDPLVVGLAGTDLYVDLPDDADAAHSIAVASHLVVLQARALDRLAVLAPGAAARTTVIHQAVEPPLPAATASSEDFTVAVLAHLRTVKDPLMAARASRLLPAASRVTVLHGGAAHDERWRRRANRETGANPRYRWLGELGRSEALALLAGAHVLACTSTVEGGANVVGEAIAIGVPVIGTAIDGNVGLLGERYPGLVPIGDDRSLADLLLTLERDPAALDELRRLVVARQHLFTVEAERAAWRMVLDTRVERPGGHRGSKTTGSTSGPRKA